MTLAGFQEERDVQSGYLEEADEEREERVLTTVGTKLEARTLSAAGKSALRYRPLEERDEYTDDGEEEEAPSQVYRTRAVARARAGNAPGQKREVITHPPQQARYTPAPKDAQYEDEETPYMTQRRQQRQASEFGGPTDEDPQ